MSLMTAAASDDHVVCSFYFRIGRVFVTGADRVDRRSTRPARQLDAAARRRRRARFRLRLVDHGFLVDHWYGRHRREWPARQIRTARQRAYHDVRPCVALCQPQQRDRGVTRKAGRFRKDDE
jgi:hypothetical protein